MTDATQSLRKEVTYYKWIGFWQSIAPPKCKNVRSLNVSVEPDIYQLVETDLENMPHQSKSSPNLETGYIYRDALRLLFILVRGSGPLTSAPEEWDRVFVGEKKALAIDFWLRYPDYLADELLDLFESLHDLEAFDAADNIFTLEEPSVRLIKMIRWKRGAYEDLQTSLALLVYRGLVKTMRRKLSAEIWQHEFLTGPHARAFLEIAVTDQPILSWYETQTDLALRVAHGKSGSALKDMHYLDPEYASTPFGSSIPSIRDRVQDRLNRLKKEI